MDLRREHAAGRLVDLEEAATTGGGNYLSHYSGADTAGRRLREIVVRSVEGGAVAA